MATYYYTNYLDNKIIEVITVNTAQKGMRKNTFGIIILALQSNMQIIMLTYKH